MTTVETTISITIAETGVSLQSLEAAVAEALGKAGRELLLAACAAVERNLFESAGKRWLRNKRRPLDLLTRFGWVRLERWQVQHRSTRRYHSPLDDVLQLAPRQHASPWVLAQAVALATRIPYRQATQLLTGWLDAPVDHRTVYAWVQQAGAGLVAAEDAQQEAVFANGEVPPRAPGEREVVVAEVDGTFIKAQREGVPAFEVRLGLLYSGKTRESPSAKYRRYRLQERVRYGGVESAEAFGERFFLAGEASLALTRAHHLLVVGDGAEWIETLAGHERWKATYQLDWWHLTHAFHRTFPDRPELIAQLKEALYQGQGDRVVQLVALAQTMGNGDQERIAQLHGYLVANQHGFYSAWQLRKNLSPDARLVAVVGSGAIEKQQDLVVGRRFKGQGMRWTRTGANRLLKLRLGELDRAA
jgi:hypothetical protein